MDGRAGMPVTASATSKEARLDRRGDDRPARPASIGSAAITSEYLLGRTFEESIGLRLLVKLNFTRL
jgi:hypothetical protein